jgi:SAM-dependent methyltransferase
MDLKESNILCTAINDHWYYKSKMKAVTCLLGSRAPTRILDVGAGSGFFSRGLLAHSSAKQACCVDTSYSADSDAIEAGKPIYFRRSVDKVDADLVLMMDVLEHVDDDVGLLREYVAKVPSGTRFLISVPAFQFLWSDHDVFLEHKRRYRLSQIEEVAEQAGLSVKQGIYFFGAVFPIAAPIRLVSKVLRKDQKPRSQLALHHPLVNGTLAALSRLELPFIRYNRLAGLTAFCLAEKP